MPRERKIKKRIDIIEGTQNNKQTKCTRQRDDNSIIVRVLSLVDITTSPSPHHCPKSNNVRRHLEYLLTGNGRTHFHCTQKSPIGPGGNAVITRRAGLAQS